MPLLVVVTGPPASGKTTVARPLATELGLPLLAKDAVKETLFDVLGAGDRPWSRRLGHATYAVLFLIAGELLGAGRPLVLEANFARGPAEEDFRALPPHRLLQVLCSAPDDIVLERWRGRALRGERHPGHVDLEIEHEVVAALRERRHDALDLPGERIEIDTTRPVRLDEVVAAAARLLAADA